VQPGGSAVDRVRWAAAVLTVVVMTSCGSGRGEKFAPVAGGSSTSTPSAGTATTAAPDPGAVAARIEALLEQNSGARAPVASAVQGVSGCSLDPAQGASAVSAAIQTRQAVLGQVTSLDVAALPEGAQLRDLFTQALQHSIEADQHFVAWMTGMGSTGCTTNTPEFAAATAASGAATASKQAFVAAWAPVANRFGLRQWAEPDL